MTTLAETERTLAVVTNWGLFGGFGLCFVLSGFANEAVAVGLIGFAAFVAGFAAHVIINRWFSSGFSDVEIVVGFIVFCVSVLCFLAAWVFGRQFGHAGVVIGLSGFAAVIGCFLVYVVATYGIGGASSMFHRRRGH
jgi:hypothetical protein